MDEGRLEELFAEAEELETAMEFDRVVEIAKEMVAADGSNVRALLLGAGSLVSKGDESSEQEARQWYQKAIELEPDDGYEKFFAFAQLNEGNLAVELYEKGLRILDSEITRLNKGEEKDKLKQERVEALRSLAEVYVSDLSGMVYLNKARDLILKLLKDESNVHNSYDVFLLAQVYDKLGRKYKSEIHVLCKATTRRLLTEEADEESDEKLGDFLSKFAYFCLDYGFLTYAKHVIDRLGLVGGKSGEYLSLKAVCYRKMAEAMLKKCHYYADSCLEWIDEMEEEGEADGTQEMKESMEEMKKTTPQQLPKMFTEGAESNGDHTKENLVETEDEEDDVDDSDDDDDDFSVDRKPITNKRHQKLLELEKKRIYELCKIDVSASEGQVTDMEM